MRQDLRRPILFVTYNGVNHFFNMTKTMQENSPKKSNPRLLLSYQKAL